MCYSKQAESARREQYEVIAPDDSTFNRPNTAAFLSRSGVENGDMNPAKSSGGLFRSSALRAIIAVTTVALFALVMISNGMSSFRSTSSALKDLSDQVVALTRKIDADAVIIRQGHEVQHEMEDAEVELSWEHQHVSELEEAERQMMASFQSYHQFEEKKIESFELKNKATGERAKAVTKQLEYEVGENIELKAALKNALSSMAELRKNHPPATPRGENNSAAANAKLRGGKPSHSYQPGDSVEIFVTHQGPTTLHPGLVSDVVKTPAGVVEAGGPEYYYNLVKLESGVILNHLYDTQFRVYQIIPPGERAYFMEKRGVYVPITIGEYQKDAPPGFEVHGNYEITVDGSGAGVKHFAQALRIYRNMPVDDPLNDGLHGLSLHDRAEQVPR